MKWEPSVLLLLNIEINFFFHVIQLCLKAAARSFPALVGLVS
jgi:hypothetical protein